MAELQIPPPPPGFQMKSAAPPPPPPGFQMVEQDRPEAEDLPGDPEAPPVPQSVDPRDRVRKNAAGQMVFHDGTQWRDALTGKPGAAPQQAPAPVPAGVPQILAEEPAHAPTLINSQRIPASQVIAPPDERSDARKFLETPLISPRDIEQAMPFLVGPFALHKGLLKSGAAMTSPESAAIVAGTGGLGMAADATAAGVAQAARVAQAGLSTYFATQAGRSVLQKSPEIQKAWKAGDWQGVLELGGGTLLDAAVAAASTAHAVGSVKGAASIGKTARALQDKLASEEAARRAAEPKPKQIAGPEGNAPPPPEWSEARKFLYREQAPPESSPVPPPPEGFVPVEESAIQGGALTRVRPRKAAKPAAPEAPAPASEAAPAISGDTSAPLEQAVVAPPVEVPATGKDSLQVQPEAPPVPAPTEIPPPPEGFKRIEAPQAAAPAETSPVPADEGKGADSFAQALVDGVKHDHARLRIFSEQSKHASPADPRLEAPSAHMNGVLYRLRQDARTTDQGQHYLDAAKLLGAEVKPIPPSASEQEDWRLGNPALDGWHPSTNYEVALPSGDNWRVKWQPSRNTTDPANEGRWSSVEMRKRETASATPGPAEPPDGGAASNNELQSSSPSETATETPYTQSAAPLVDGAARGEGGKSPAKSTRKPKADPTIVSWTGEKHPWALTKSDYVKRELARPIDPTVQVMTGQMSEKARRIDAYDSHALKYQPDSVKAEAKQLRQQIAERKRQVESGAGDPFKESQHRSFVQMAIAGGKPVPAEVLADYPDLGGAAEPAAPVQPNALKAAAAKNALAAAERKAKLAGAVQDRLSKKSDQDLQVLAEHGKSNVRGVAAEILKQRAAKVSQYTPAEMEPEGPLQARRRVPSLDEFRAGGEKEPRLNPEHVRLYRGHEVGEHPSDALEGNWWTPEFEHAEQVALDRVEGHRQVSYVDLPKDDVRKYSAYDHPDAAKMIGVDEDPYILPSRISARRKALYTYRPEVDYGEFDDDPLQSRRIEGPAFRPGMSRSARVTESQVQPMRAGREKYHVLAVNAQAMDLLHGAMGIEGGYDIPGVTFTVPQAETILRNVNTELRKARLKNKPDEVAKWSELRDAIEANRAATKGGPLAAVQNGADVTPEEHARALQEELDHVDQLKATGDFYGNHLGPEGTKAFLGSRNGSIAAAAVRRSYPDAGDSQVVMEVGVRLMRTGRYRELDLTPDQARDLQDDYVNSLIERHGVERTVRITDKITVARERDRRIQYEHRTSLQSRRGAGRDEVKGPDRSQSPGPQNAKAGAGRGGSGLSGVPEGPQSEAAPLQVKSGGMTDPEYRDYLYRLGERIRGGEQVPDSEIESLRTSDDIAGFKRLKHEYRPRPKREEYASVKIIRSRNGFEEVRSEFTSSDPVDDFYYHVTTKGRAMQVMSGGLRAGRTQSMAEGFYREYSKGKVFFSERNGVSYWQEKIEAHLADQSENPPKLAVIRFPKGAVGDVQKDELGTRDSARPSYYTDRPIKPEGPLQAKRDEGPEFVKRPSLARAAADFLKPLETRIGQEGPAGLKLKRHLIRAEDVGEVQAGKRVVQLRDAGLQDLSRTDRQNLVDALQGFAQPKNPAVQKALDGIRKVTDGIAAESTAAGVQSRQARTIRPEDPVPPTAKLTQAQKDLRAAGKRVFINYKRPFQARGNFYPHVIPAPDDLRSGDIRKDVAENMVRNGVVPFMEDATAMIDEYRKFIDTGERSKKLEQHLVDSGQARDTTEAHTLMGVLRRRTIKRQGSLEYSRQVDLPFYDPDPARVLPKFVTATSLRLAQIREFGQNDELVNKLIHQIDMTTGNPGFARSAVDHILRKVREGDTAAARIARVARAFNGFKLGLSFIPNSTQGALNSFLKSDLPSTIAGVKGLASKEGRRFAMQSGASLDGVVNEMLHSVGADNSALGKYLKASGFNLTEQSNRVVAANAGYAYAKRMLAKLKANPQDGRARKVLIELGLKPDVLLRIGKIDGDAALIAAKKFSDITQFRAGAKDLPFFATNSPIGKMLFQFKSFVYGQTRLVYSELVDELKAGRPGRAFRTALILATVFPLAGEVISDLRTWIKGGERKTSGIQRWLEDIGQAGALGVVYDMLEAGSYRKGVEFVAGPTLSELGQFMNIASAANKAREMEKWIVRHVPTLGSLFYSRIFPPPPPAQSPAMKKLMGNRPRKRKP